ncbi:hypothetical protein ACWF9B_00505 [Streptomyces sp. NPDC055089]
MPHDAPKPLPVQWTIHIHTALNLTILTLIDPDNGHREIGYAPLTPPGAMDRTVEALEEITEPELRAHAQQLIDTFYQRTTTAQANLDALDAAVPDLSQLLNRLSSTAPTVRPASPGPLSPSTTTP